MTIVVRLKLNTSNCANYYKAVIIVKQQLKINHYKTVIAILLNGVNEILLNGWGENK